MKHFILCQLYVGGLLSCDIFDVRNDLSDTNFCSCVKSYEREPEREREREREMVLAQYWFDGILSTIIGEAWEVNQWKPCTVGDIFQGETWK